MCVKSLRCDICTARLQKIVNSKNALFVNYFFCVAFHTHCSAYFMCCFLCVTIVFRTPSSGVTMLQTKFECFIFVQIFLVIIFPMQINPLCWMWVREFVYFCCFQIVYIYKLLFLSIFFFHLFKFIFLSLHVQFLLFIIVIVLSF